MGLSDVVSPPSGVSIDNDDITVDDTEGGVVLLEANSERKSALIINIGAEPMRVTTDGSVPTATHGKLVIGGASLTLSSPCSVKEIKAIRQGDNNTTVNASEVN